MKNKNEIEKPTFFVYIIIGLVSIICLFFLCITLWGKRNVKLDNSRLSIKLNGRDVKSKATCNTTTTYCFEDADCQQQCSESGVACLHGICKSNINRIDANNECDPQMGVLGYLVGNTALGTYQYICKSIDPGIAISPTENRMCYGDNTYHVNYLDGFPSMTDCRCEGAIVVPATRTTRAHIECNKAFTGMFQ